MPKKPVKVYLTTPQRNALAKMAKANEISCSEILRNAFRMYAREWIKAETHPDTEAGVKDQ